MKIECPKCKAAYNVDDTKLPDKGVLVKCKKCKNQFFLKKETKLVVDQIEEVEELEEVIESEPQTMAESKECPRCALPQHGIDECEYCGYIFERKRPDDRPSVKRPVKIEKKPSTIGSFLGWGFGLMCLAVGLFKIVFDPLPSLFFIIIAIVLIPPLSRLIEKWLIFFPRGVKFSIVFFCLVAAGMFLPEQQDEKKTPTTTLPKITKSEKTRSSTYKPKVDCWELGYKYGRCARMSFFGLQCNPSDDIILPLECRNKRITEMGMKRGMESVK